jgi:DNA-binding CsgD family transcriptional regulator
MPDWTSSPSWASLISRFGWWLSTGRTWPSWTCGCRPLTPMKVCGPRWKSASAGLRRQSWCCRYVERHYATQLLAGDTRGIGYLLKDRVADMSEFVTTLQRVAAGGTALDPEVISQLLARSRRSDPLATLTPRESEVLRLMAEGRSNAAIAAELVVSDGAVEKHVSNIFAKLSLAPTDTDHRRVLAVLRYLES